jgi:hypothetical protein
MPACPGLLLSFYINFVWPFFVIAAHRLFHAEEPRTTHFLELFDRQLSPPEESDMPLNALDFAKQCSWWTNDSIK